MSNSSLKVSLSTLLGLIALFSSVPGLAQKTSTYSDPAQIAATTKTRSANENFNIGVLAVQSQLDGVLFVDGQRIKPISPGNVITLKLTAGQHFVDLLDQKGNTLWQKVVEVPIGAQVAALVELEKQSQPAGSPGVKDNLDEPSRAPAAGKSQSASANSLAELRAPGVTYMTTSIPVGSNPSFLAVNTVTNKIYVAHVDSNDITVIDGATNRTSIVASTSRATAGAHAHSIAVNSSTNKIYVTNFDSNDVTLIDGASNTAVTIPVGIHPCFVAVNSRTNKVYVSNSDSDSITVIDGKTNKTQVVRVAKLPGEIAINEITNAVYVACGNSKNVAVIDGNKDKVKALIEYQHWEHLAVDQGTNRIYTGGLSVIPGHAGTIIDGNSNVSRELKTATPLEFVTSIAVNPVTHKAYLSNFFGKKGDPIRNEIVIVDGLTNKVQEVKLGSLLPGEIAINSATNKIYVTYFDSDTVTEIDGATNVVSTIAPGKESASQLLAEPVVVQFPYSGAAKGLTGSQ